MRLAHLTLFAFLFASSASAQKMFPSSAVAEAAERIYVEIKDRHPYVATVAGLRGLEAARTRVQSELETEIAGRDSITYGEFVDLVVPLQRVTNCGHLILRPNLDSTTEASIKSNYFPLSILEVADGSYVLRKRLATTTDTLAPGTTITHLNGRKIADVLNELAPFSGSNDNGYDDAARFNMASGISTPYQRFYGLQDSLKITTVDGARAPATYTLMPDFRPYVDKKKVKTPMGETLRFRLTDDGNVGILRIKKFSAYKFTDGDYYDFIDQVFDTLKATGTDQLIIDIRYNGGGSSSRIKYLYSYLAEGKFKFTDQAILTGPAHATAGDSRKIKRRRAAGAVTRRERKLQKALTRRLKPKKKEEIYSGKVVVLINEGSFSASGIFARMVQGSGRGKLVGSVSGASASIMYGGRSDSEPLLIGPNHEFELLVNTIGLIPEYPAPGNVTPDHLVRPTLEGLRAGRDEELEVALEILK